MSEKTKNLPRAVTYEDDELEDPDQMLRKRRGVTIIDTARRDP